MTLAEAVFSLLLHVSRPALVPLLLKQVTAAGHARLAMHMLVVRVTVVLECVQISPMPGTTWFRTISCGVMAAADAASAAPAQSGLCCAAAADLRMGTGCN